eukprot:jgi/Chlat1/5264/Chrsp33S05014
MMTARRKRLNEESVKVGRVTANAAANALTSADVASEVRVGCGDPRDVLCDICKDVDADLLVMGSRGLGAVSKFMLGSTADYCVHHSPCAVLIVKAPGDQPAQRPHRE